jgi:hypothetical protein
MCATTSWGSCTPVCRALPPPPPPPPLLLLLPPLLLASRALLRVMRRPAASPPSPPPCTPPNPRQLLMSRNAEAACLNATGKMLCSEGCHRPQQVAVWNLQQQESSGVAWRRTNPAAVGAEAAQDHRGLSLSQFGLPLKRCNTAQLGGLLQAPFLCKAGSSPDAPQPPAPPACQPTGPPACPSCIRA